MTGRDVAVRRGISQGKRVGYTTNEPLLTIAARRALLLSNLRKTGDHNSRADQPWCSRRTPAILAPPFPSFLLIGTKAGPSNCAHAGPWGPSALSIEFPDRRGPSCALYKPHVRFQIPSQALESVTNPMATSAE